tara:strand:+ start:1066 stop:1779 length:714 start_codon:yes stop_codon:yes gene_type:complete
MIDSVRQTVLSVLNKNNYGYISPSDFNLFAKQAQLEIFSGYFKELNQVINAENARMSGTEYADLNKGVREAIDIFSVTNDLTVNTDPNIPNSFFTPSLNTTGDDYFLLNKVLYRNTEVERVTHGKITLLNNSLLTAPSFEYPAYTLDGNIITVYPATIDTQGDISCQYIRYPFDPQWTYVTLGNGEPVFNASAADYQDFEVPIDDEPRLVYRILQMAGMSIREGDVYQYANAEEAQN